MKLNTPIGELKGVGEQQTKKYELLGIKNVGQLITYFPRRYEDYSHVTPVSHLKPGPVTVQAVIKHVTGRYVRRGMHITEAIASDDSGSIRLVWFNQSYRLNSIKSDQLYYVSGVYELRKQRFSLINPSLELSSEFPINTARILPIYRETKGLTSKQIRAALYQTLPFIESLPETLPGWLVASEKLLSRAEAVQRIHFPGSSKQLEEAQHRLGFEEVFQLTLASLLNKDANKHEAALRVPYRDEIAQRFVKALPFQLTDDQRRVTWQIYLDLQKKLPMNRLIEGDVGSGKTVVAAMAAVMVLAQDLQVALMAPTELLARQHAVTIHKLLQPLGMEHAVDLLVGSLKPAQKQRARQAIASGKAQFIIGTQALISEKVNMKSLAFVIIDEQHRFGVEQRKQLQSKAGHMPHILSMTATPIPRSLALTLYGELDVSVLAEKPKERQVVTTKIVSPNSRAEVYKEIDAQLEQGRQMFVVCPLISESKIQNSLSAEDVYEQLKKHEFKHRRIGLLHGKLNAAQKEAVMQQFIDGTLDILVTTTVIEVGVDIPNATIMLIENADRFGLAQTHQLRGRVGRGQHAAYCYLMLSDSQPPSRRLRALESSNDGFRLAELDLELRGPGAIYGAMQHGQLDLRIAKLTDTKLIARARAAARLFLDHHEDLLQYKELATRVAFLRTVTNLN